MKLGYKETSWLILKDSCRPTGLNFSSTSQEENWKVLLSTAGNWKNRWSSLMKFSSVNWPFCSTVISDQNNHHCSKQMCILCVFCLSVCLYSLSCLSVCWSERLSVCLCVSVSVVLWALLFELGWQQFVFATLKIYKHWIFTTIKYLFRVPG